MITNHHSSHSICRPKWLTWNLNDSVRMIYSFCWNLSCIAWRVLQKITFSMNANIFMKYKIYELVSLPFFSPAPLLLSSLSPYNIVIKLISEKSIAINANSNRRVHKNRVFRGATCAVWRIIVNRSRVRYKPNRSCRMVFLPIHIKIVHIIS